MLNGRMFFPLLVRMISRSCTREKALTPLDKKLVIDTQENLSPVETDTEKLAKYVCGSNLLIENGEDIKLKEDSEYPDWLWKIHSPLPFEQLDPKTKTYWNKVRKIREKEKKYLLIFLKHKTVHK